ncbi:hypothetical protein CDAR_250901 [Caerostris darwini]|uniref:Uncharacterized protein n=1 Tax=Caerostris darwini TaxID=1538125 RepID=A0AAV4TPG1_9ARAC|nr:hypothetical protein CDAR_250901 [Caerostris darwini]
MRENIPFWAPKQWAAFKSGFLRRMRFQSSWQEQSPSAAPVNRSQGGIHAEDPLLIKSPPNLSSAPTLRSWTHLLIKTRIILSLRSGRFL